MCTKLGRYGLKAALMAEIRAGEPSAKEMVRWYLWRQSVPHLSADLRLEGERKRGRINHQKRTCIHSALQPSMNLCTKGRCGGRGKRERGREREREREVGGESDRERGKERESVRERKREKTRGK